jgi:hypothetical protein
LHQSRGFDQDASLPMNVRGATRDEIGAAGKDAPSRGSQHPCGPLSIRSRSRRQRRIDLLARVHMGSTDLFLRALLRDPGVRGMGVTLVLQTRKEGSPELTTTFHVKHARCGDRGCSSPSQLSRPVFHVKHRGVSANAVVHVSRETVMIRANSPVGVFTVSPAWPFSGQPSAVRAWEQ